MTIGTIYRQFIDNSIEEGTMMEHQQKNVFVLFLGIVFLCIPTYTFSITIPRNTVLLYECDSVCGIVGIYYTLLHKENQYQYSVFFHLNRYTYGNKYRNHLLFYL